MRNTITLSVVLFLLVAAMTLIVFLADRHTFDYIKTPPARPIYTPESKR